MQDGFMESIIKSIQGRWVGPALGGGLSKRFNAIRNVWKKISERFPDNNPFDELEPMIFFAPSADTAGEVKGSTLPGPFVYLSPTLELESIRQVEHTVAHELAHLMLGHHKQTQDELARDDKGIIRRHGDTPQERAADELSTQWGFPSKKYKSRFAKMVSDTKKPKSSIKFSKADAKQANTTVIEALKREGRIM